MIKKLKVYLRPVELSRLIKKLKFFIIFINGGILSLTDSHHNHHGQKPTMVGICHGGNVPVSHDDDDDDDDDDDGVYRHLVSVKI